MFRSQTTVEFNMFVAFAILALQSSSLVRVNAEVAPASCGYVDVMSQEMRQTILDEHNKLRDNLARGKVQRSSLTGAEKLPQAADMREMKYDCALEKKALDEAIFQHDCKEIPPRTAFTDTGRNYRYINTTMRFRRPIMTPEQALVKAAREWWNLRLYSKFENVTPEKDNFPAIPFFMMGMAATEELGCAVTFCPGSKRNYYAVYCYYGKPHVKVGKPIYKIGKPCTQCPFGYQCAGLKKLCRRTLF